MTTSNNSSRRAQVSLRAAVLAVGLALGWIPSAFGQNLDRRVAYQGQLTGVIGATTIQFRIFDAAGTPVWGPEIHVVTPDAEGRFVAVVGATGLDVSPADGVPDLDQLAPAKLELEVAVEDPGGGSMTVLSPRQKLFAAFHASTASEVLDDSIRTASLVDQAVTNEKLADGAVDGPKIADGAVNSAKLTDGSIALADLSSVVLSARHYLQNDILLRFGPCPAGFSQLVGSTTFTTYLIVGTPNEGSTSRPRLGDFDTPGGVGTEAFRVALCRCVQAVCN